jgi:D-sedoheptulose 7-phosphate isomerase
MTDAARHDLVTAALRDSIRLRERVLASHVPAIVDFGRRLGACLLRGHTVFLCGNGGSAADSQHIAAEIVGRFKAERRGLPAIALTTDTSAITAIANDYGYEVVFARQLEALARPGDMLVGISTSGNSPNVVAAARSAARLGVETVVLTGGTGGLLAGTADCVVCVPETDTARIQEVHIMVGHLACEMAERTVMEDAQ